MPELPEVETIRQDLTPRLLRRKITAVEILDKKRVSPAGRFAAVLKGNHFIRLERRGKLLIFKLAESGEYLLVHLKMTGQLIYRRGRQTIYGGHDVPKMASDLPNKFTRVIFHFADQSTLFFNDLRRFGYLKIVDEADKEKILTTGFGPDALDRRLTFQQFKTILIRRQKSKIKAILMNQKTIAGVGNIYADEILFAAGVLPWRTIVSLSEAEWKKIYQNLSRILRQAIRHRGTTFGTYVDGKGQRGNFADFLKVYRREKEKCPRCQKGIIQKKNFGGRGTRFCLVCQK